MDNLIYHYTGAEALKSIVLSQSFWITKSDYLNDTSEQIMVRELIQSYFKENAMKMSVKIQKYILEEFDRYFTEYNHYILSFSQGDDSLPLWNYYADSEGYNLGIDKKELIKTFKSYFEKIDPNVKVEIISITYGQQKEKDDEKIIKNLLHPYIFFTDEDLTNKKDRISELLIALANISFSIKHNAYLMEKEERLVVICKKNSPIVDKEQFRVLRGSFIPYIIFNAEFDLSLKIPIKNIRVGPYHTMDVTEKSVLYLMKRMYEDFSSDKISKSKIPSRY